MKLNLIFQMSSSKEFNFHENTGFMFAVIFYLYTCSQIREFNEPHCSSESKLYAIKIMLRLLANLEKVSFLQQITPTMFYTKFACNNQSTFGQFGL